MPQYHIDLGSPEAARTYQSLDAFTRGYIEAAFWTDCNEDNEELADGTFADLAPATLASMIDDCRAFQELARVDLIAAYGYRRFLEPNDPRGYSETSAGVDFWLTRNGHGAGFWDRGFGDLRTDTVGGRLSRDAKSFGTVDLYRGDDGLIYS